MDWSNHVDAVQASWVLKYLHPSKSLWKSLLDVIMFRDDEGRLILGGERELLMCPLTRGDKYQLLKQLPRRATYIKECLKAHWKVGYKLDENERYDHDGMGAENIWHNHRFYVTCNRRVRWYMVNVLDVTQVSNIMDYATKRPFTAEKWWPWIRRYHLDHLGEVPPDSLVAKRVDQMMEVAAQVPEYVIEDMEDTADHQPEDGELVGLIWRDGQDTMEDVVYAKYEERQTIAELGMTGSWFHIMFVDSVGIAHPTDDRWPARATYEDGYGTYKIVEWPVRGEERRYGAPTQWTRRSGRERADEGKGGRTARYGTGYGTGAVHIPETHGVDDRWPAGEPGAGHSE